MGEHGKYRALVKLMSRANATIAIFAWLLTAGWANADCRQALALGLDISGSVDSSEYRLQIEGLAAALDDPSVIDAFLTMPTAPIRLFIGRVASITGQARSTLTRENGQPTDSNLAQPSSVILLRARTPICASVF